MGRGGRIARSASYRSRKPSSSGRVIWREPAALTMRAPTAASSIRSPSPRLGRASRLRRLRPAIVSLAPLVPTGGECKKEDG
jgi:hypothetical protein